ncbi:MAG: hypothetical protein V3T86_16205 [Planctomycetota bacterium]
MSMSKRDRGCHIVFVDAPEGTTMRAANDAINEYTADRRRGMAMFHDHFANRAGGLIVLAIETEEQLALLSEPGPLEGWSVRTHPLIFADSASRFLNQVDFTLNTYRDRRLTEFLDLPADDDG